MVGLQVVGKLCGGLPKDGEVPQQGVTSLTVLDEGS
jgi:hypothetical protein